MNFKYDKDTASLRWNTLNNAEQQLSKFVSFARLLFLLVSKETEINIKFAFVFVPIAFGGLLPYLRARQFFFIKGK